MRLLCPAPPDKSLPAQALGKGIGPPPKSWRPATLVGGFGREGACSGCSGDEALRDPCRSPQSTWDFAARGRWGI